MNESKQAFTVRQNAAIDFMRMFHKTQRRKGTPVPYIIHPMEVAYFCGRFYPENQDLIIAGYLHDTIEDSDATFGMLKELFNEHVANMVQAVTVTKMPTWKETREVQLEKLRTIYLFDKDVARLKAADMLSNAQSIARDVRLFGVSAFDKFKGSQEDVIWYYTQAIVDMHPFIGDEPILKELSNQVNGFE